jgi:hypothetical protein
MKTIRVKLSIYFRVFIYSMLIRGGKHSSYMTTIMAFIFCLCNSYAIVQDILAYQTYANDYLLSVRFLLGRFVELNESFSIGLGLGSILFLVGFLLNLQADSILRNLRTNDQERDYKIPQGQRTSNE